MSDDMETMTLGGFDVEIEPSGKTEELDIYNCLLTLYGSKEGEQALDREFGLNMECLSLPAEAAQAMLTAEIIRKTKNYEPRAEVLEEPQPARTHPAKGGGTDCLTLPSLPIYRSTALPETLRCRM